MEYESGQTTPMPKLATISERAKATCPTATHLLGLLGEPVDAAYGEALAGKFGADWLYLLTDEERICASFGSVWKKIRDREYWEILELFLAEHWISSQPERVTLSLGPYMTFDKTLHTVRSNIALALYSRAKDLNWREPLSFVRALRLSEQYLTGVVANNALSQPTALKQFEGRLGVSLILQSRYTDLNPATIEAAIAHIIASIDHGNQSRDAYGYLVEGYLRMHDATSQVDSLLKIKQLHETLPPSLSSEQLEWCAGEAWVRLSETTTHPQVSKIAMNRARTIANEADAVSDPLSFIRLAILQAFIDTRNAKVGETILLRGFRIPFGLGTQVRRWFDSNPESAIRLVDRIIANLNAAPRRFRDEPLIRRITASAHSSLARAASGKATTEMSIPRTIQHLEAAISIRAGGGGLRRLADPESDLENSLDLFTLSRLTRTPGRLVSAIRQTLVLAEFDQAWPTPLLLLARELLELGPDAISLQVATELRREARHESRILRATLDGDTEALFQIAASRALASRELDRKRLGGRGTVFLAEDVSGVATETFVFKATTSALAKRETDRSDKLDAVIRERGRESDFATARTLASTALPEDDVLRLAGAEVLVARQFHPGSLLGAAVATLPLNAKESTLLSTAEFLALIHSSEPLAAGTGGGCRRDLLKKEFGRWLRDGVRCDDARDLFGAWFDLFPAGIPLLSRRDAHHLNWLVTANNQVVALDLEACGWRPAGYEIAQLIDDAPLLPVDESGWAVRERIVNQYGVHLERYGVVVGKDALMDAFELSLIARAVGALTAPTSEPQSRRHAEQLLDWIRDRANNPDVGVIASRVRDAWARRRGTTDRGERRLADISDARRRHLSRAMAFELRHGESTALSDGGWTSLSSLASTLRQSGLRTSADELGAIAAAIDEPRFELNGSTVRALYGHSRPVVIGYEKVERRPVLYHGTAFTNLNAIFEQRQGLLPMSRHWVHLSTDPLAAQRTAERHGPGVLLVIEPSNDLDVFASGGPVHLARHVPAKFIRIATPAEMFLASG